MSAHRPIAAGGGLSRAGGLAAAYGQRGDQPPGLSQGALDDGAGFALRDFEHQDTCPHAYRVVATTEDLQ